MDIKDWLEFICAVGNLVFAILNYFNGKKIAEQRPAS